MKLTKTNIDKAVYTGSGSSPCFIWDDEIHGFGLRIYPSGKKTFVLDYRMDQRQHRIVLGAYGAITLQQARDIARDRLYEITKGINPIQKKKEARQAIAIEALCNQYIEHAKKRGKRSWKQDYNRFVRIIIPAWGKRKARSITRRDVSSLHNKIGDAGKVYEANRIVALISSLFKYAEKNELIPEGFANPAHGIEKYKETKRDVWVHHDQLPQLAQAIDAEPNPYIRSAFWMLLLLGLRKNELLSMRWDDIDFPRRIVRIPKTKNGKIHELPLSQPALDLLQALPRVLDNPFVFVGAKQGSHLVNVDDAWQRIRERAGMQNIRIHDLRRTLGSWLATDGASLPLIGSVLNHSDPSTTQIYAKIGQNPVKNLLDQHAQKVINITNLQNRKKAEGE